MSDIDIREWLRRHPMGNGEVTVSQPVLALPPSVWERPVTDEEIREIREWMREHPMGKGEVAEAPE